MSFGRNPHVAKAEAAELKAQTAKDDVAREQAWREAARQWDRAADKEVDDKQRSAFTAKAEEARSKADGEEAPTADASVEDRVAKARVLLN